MFILRTRTAVVFKFKPHHVPRLNYTNTFLLSEWAEICRFMFSTYDNAAWQLNLLSH